MSNEKKNTSVYLYRDDIIQIRETAKRIGVKPTEIYRNAVHWYAVDGDVEAVMDENTLLKLRITELEKQVKAHEKSEGVDGSQMFNNTFDLQREKDSLKRILKPYTIDYDLLMNRWESVIGLVDEFTWSEYMKFCEEIHNKIHGKGDE